MKDSFYLFLICLFFISCNRSIHFDSEAKDPAHFIDHSLHYGTPKFTSPDPEQPVSLNDQGINFIQLASADTTALRLPVRHPVDFTNEYQVSGGAFIREDMSVSPTISREATLVSDGENPENGTIEFDFTKQRQEELVVAMAEKKQPRYPVSPEGNFEVGLEGSNEGFVPESGLTIGGHEGFTQLASADVNSLRLSVNRPVDVVDNREEVEGSFVRSKDISMSPAISGEATLAHPTNTEDEAIKWDLAEQERQKLDIDLTEREQLHYPVSPEGNFEVRLKDSNENFVPESGLTIEGHEGFVQLASADVNFLRLSVNRPVDVVDNREEVEGSFVRSKDISMSPAISGEATLAHPTNTEDEAIKWDLAEQERQKLDVDLMKREQPHYPSSPLWVVEAGKENNAPEEIFIPRLLDILFVVDTSESMHEHLVSFKEKFMGFLSYFFNFNWKLAITNADHGEHGFFLFNISPLKGKAMRLERDGSVMNLRYLDRTVEHYNQVFLDSISRHRLHEYQKQGQDGLENVDYCKLPPYCQGGNEQPLKSLKAALSKNRDFYRENADLVVVVISNSRERAGDYESGTQPEEVIEEFTNLYGEEKRFEVYGIIIPEDGEECLEQNNEAQFWAPEGDFSEKIARLSAMTGGETFSICSDNYEELARSIFHSFGTSEEE